MQWSVRTMDSMVMQFHIVAAPLSQQPGKLGDDKTELKKKNSPAQMHFGGYPPLDSRHPVAGPEATRTIAPSSLRLLPDHL